MNQWQMGAGGYRNLFGQARNIEYESRAIPKKTIVELTASSRTILARAGATPMTSNLSAVRRALKGEGVRLVFGRNRTTPRKGSRPLT